MCKGELRDATEASPHGYLVTEDAFAGTEDAGTDTGMSCASTATGSAHLGCQQESESWACIYSLHFEMWHCSTSGSPASYFTSCLVKEH